MIVVPRAGKALILALFCVFAAACGSKSGVQPKRVDSAVLQAQVNDPLERAFYQARQWQPAWDGKSEKALLAIVDRAPANGLKPDLFLKGDLPADPSAREAALTRIALRYASALANGYADPRKLREIYTLPRPKTNVAAGLAEALADGELDRWFASLVPQTDEYRTLSEAHLQYLRLATQAHAQPVPAGKTIKPGQRDPRVPQVAAALAASGYLPAPPPNAVEKQALSERYSPAMAAAMRRLQADYGLKPDAIVGPDTLAVLNSGPSDRARQLAVALERLRWLERSPPATRIDVNTAAAFLQYIRGGRPVDRRKVVVGEPGWETPQLQSQMFQLVANPLWRVPDSILEDELSKKSGAYLARNGFEWRDGRLVQRSGPKNSLGLVKFDLTNKQSIYLHDTPAKALFALPERHRSHGCIRVDNALQFAAMIAAENAILDELEEGLASGDETYIKLKTEIPVRLLYHTAFLDGGRVQLRPDIYGWDDDVAYAIGLKRGPPRKAYKRPAEDIGP